MGHLNADHPEPRADRNGSNQWLSELLSASSAKVVLHELPHHWQQTDIHFVCDRPRSFVPGFWMARSVRGAMGRVLKQWFMDGRPSDFPASAFEALYQHHGHIGRDHIGTPMRFSVSATHDTIGICVRLFGLGDLWRDDVIEAMSTALHSGIGLKENGSILRPWPMRDWYFRKSGIYVPPPVQDFAVVRFETPFKPGSSGFFSGDFIDSLPSLVRRLQALSRWMLLDVQLDWPAIKAMIGRIEPGDEQNGLRIEGFARRTRADAGSRQEQAIIGLIGHQFVLSIPAAFWPILSLGSQSHIGGHGAYGFGQFVVGE